MKLLLFLLAGLLYSQQTGYVIKIADGDTFTMIDSLNVKTRVRLASIDCPERKQPFGNKAKKRLSELVFNKTVYVYPLKYDRYGRLVAFVKTNPKDKFNVSEVLLKEGLAWHYRKYSIYEHLQSLEDSARVNKLGLWCCENTPPWEWRKR